MRQVTVNETWPILAVWTVTRDILPKMRFPPPQCLKVLASCTITNRRTVDGRLRRPASRVADLGLRA